MFPDIQIVYHFVLDCVTTKSSVWVFHKKQLLGPFSRGKLRCCFKGSYKAQHRAHQHITSETRRQCCGDKDVSSCRKAVLFDSKTVGIGIRCYAKTKQGTRHGAQTWTNFRRRLKILPEKQNAACKSEVHHVPRKCSMHRKSWDWHGVHMQWIAAQFSEQMEKHPIRKKRGDPTSVGPNKLGSTKDVWHSALQVAPKVSTLEVFKRKPCLS